MISFIVLRTIQIMMSIPREVKSKQYVRPTNYFQKESQQKRELVRPNQIILTDFSFCETIFEKKRKRYPLFLLNKRHQKKLTDQNNFLQKEGIIIDHHITQPQSYCSVEKSEKKYRTLQKSVSATPKKNFVPLNFVRVKTPKHITTSHHFLEDIPIFQFCTQKRYLQSACTQRQPPKLKEKHKRTFTYSKPLPKNVVKDPQVNHFGAWKTIDIEYDDFF